MIVLDSKLALQKLTAAVFVYCFSSPVQRSEHHVPGCAKARHTCQSQVIVHLLIAEHAENGEVQAYLFCGRRNLERERKCKNLRPTALS